MTRNFTNALNTAVNTDLIPVKHDIVAENILNWAKNLMCCLCLNWTMKAKSFKKTISDQINNVLGCRLEWMDGKMAAKKTCM